MTDIVTEVIIQRAPTERSISPIEITKSIQTAMIPMYDDCRSTETRFCSVKKVSVVSDRKRQIASIAAMTPSSSIARMRLTIDGPELAAALRGLASTGAVE